MAVHATVVDATDRTKGAPAGRRRLVISISISISIGVVIVLSQWQEVGISLFLRR